MAFNVDALSEQVKLQDGFKLVTQGVKEGKTAKLLIGSGNFQAGVLNRAPILKFDTNITFQKQGCGRTALGDTTFGETYIDVEKLASYKDICYDVAEGTYLAQALMSTSNDPEDRVLMAEYTKQIFDKEIALMNLEVEKLIWSGDKALTNGMKFIDGIKKQLTAVTATTVTGATIAEKLQKVYLAMDEDRRKLDDAYIFLSDSVYEQYKIELWGANRFHEDADLKLAGTSIKLFPTPGLSGTREVYGMNLSNLQLGFTGSAETDNIDMWYSKDDNIFKTNAFVSVGIKVITPSEVVKAVV